MTNRIYLPERSGSGTPRPGGRRERSRSRGSLSHRQRRLFMETLEDRSLLAAIAKFDFNNDAADLPAAGWTPVLLSQATGGQIVQDPSTIKLFFSAPPSSALTGNYAAVPADAAGIKGGYLKFDIPSNESHLTFDLLNLSSQKSYVVWVLTGNTNTSGPAQSEHVVVSGAEGNHTFDASVPNQTLFVNGATGTAGSTVTVLAPILVQTPLHADIDGDMVVDDYVEVNVFKPVGTSQVIVAGVVISELPSSFTLPSSGSPFTLKVENGNRVVKDNSGTVLTVLASTGAIAINGTDAANDSLIVDCASGNPVT